MTRRTRIIKSTLRQWAIPLVVGVILFSCSEDDIIRHDFLSETIAFDASINDTPQTRSIGHDAASAKSTKVKRIDGCDSLFLHTIITDQESAIDSAVSRATPVEEMSEYGSFGVFAYVYKGSWADAKSSIQSPYMNNVEVKKNGDNWSSVKDYYWPQYGYNIRFFSYAPYKNKNIIWSDENVDFTKFGYTVPAKVSDQIDLVASSSVEYPGGGKEHQPVNLLFRHLLTAIKFSVGDDMLPGRITKISLSGVSGYGWYNFETEKWEIPEQSYHTFTQTIDKTFDGTPNTDIVSGETTFMMLPQKLPENAKIEVEFTDDFSEVTRTIKADISGTDWAIGKIVEYRISTKSIIVTPTLSVKGPELAYPYSGGEIPFDIVSYYTVSAVDEPDLSKEAAWTAQYSTDDGVTWQDQVSDWLESTVAGDGNKDILSVNLKVKPRIPDKIDEHTSVLQQRASKGSDASPFDLSMHDIHGNPNVDGMTTANCYIVSSAGTYMLPLVYGNAVKGGATNSQSYTRSTKPSNGIKTLVSHTNQAIISPFIEDNLDTDGNPNTAAGALLLWNDVSPDFITVTPALIKQNVTVDGTEKELKYVSFSIPQTSVRQGNATIAVYNNSNTILWSWHIWVTDETDETVTVTNLKNETYEMLPVNLGWVNEHRYDYNERKLKIKIIQTKTKAEKVFEITQSSHSEIRGINPGYQWGRKDPFPLGTCEGNDMTPIYDRSGRLDELEIKITSKVTRIGPAISTPMTIYINSSTQGPFNTTYYNLWNMSNNTTFTKDGKVTTAEPTLIKTIYDPCPPGYAIAGANAFTGFTTNGKTATNESSFNAELYNNGWYFYCDNAKQSTIFFPASGARDDNGNIYGVGEMYVQSGGYAYSWTAYPGSTEVGRSLRSNNSQLSPSFENQRRRALPIRPCKEK